MAGTTGLQYSALNTNLPASPNVTDPEVKEALRYIHTACQILQQAISDATRFVAKANVAITAGQYVTTTSISGECKVNLAMANDIATVAVAYAITDVAAGTWGVFILSGNNKNLTGLVPGDTYYLSRTVAGAVTNVKPTGVGQVIQTIGFALTSEQLITSGLTNSYTK